MFGSIWTLGIKVLSAGLIYVMFVLTARAMPTSEFGLFSIGFNLASLLAIIASCGVHVGINRWWPEYMASGRPEMALLSLRWGLKITTMASLGLAALMVVGTLVAALLFGREVAYLVAAALLIMPLALGDFLANALRSRGSIWMAQLPKDVIWRVGCCLLALAAAYFSLRISAWMAIMWYGILLVILEIPQSFSALRSAGSSPGPKTLLPKAVLRIEKQRWLRTVWPLWVSAVLAAMAQNLDVLIVGAFVSAETSGLYFAAVRTVGLIGLMHVASTLVCAPIISRCVHSDQVEELQVTLRLVATIVLLVTGAVFAFIIIAGPFLLSMFGAGFQNANVILRILLIGFTVNALCGPVGYVLMLSGHEKTYLKILAVTNGLTLAGQLFLVPATGAVGAAILSSAGLIVSGIWARREAINKVGVDPTALSVLLRNGKRLP